MVILTKSNLLVSFHCRAQVKLQLTSLVATELKAGRGDRVALPIDRFSVFSFKGEVADFSAVDTDRRVIVEVVVLVEDFRADEVPFGLGFAVIVRLVGFAGALKMHPNKYFL